MAYSEEIDTDKPTNDTKPMVAILRELIHAAIVSGATEGTVTRAHAITALELVKFDFLKDYPER